MASFRNLLGLPVKLWDSRAAGQVLQLSSDKEHWEFGAGGGGGTGDLDTTDALDEGRWNLYFTTRRAQDAVGGILADTATIDLAYTAGTSITATLKDLADSGTGTALVKITRDAKGRVSGTSAATTTDLAEGTNLYYTDARVRATALTGLSTATATPVTATDSVLVGVGKLQGQASAAATAIAGKEPSITPGTTAQYWRGDKTWQTLDRAAVGLGKVDNTSDADKPVSVAQAAAIGEKFDTSGGIISGDTTVSGVMQITRPSAQFQAFRINPEGRGNYLHSLSPTNNAKKIFINSTTDSGDTPPTSGEVGIDLATIGITRWVVRDLFLGPNVDNAYDLGTPTNRGRVAYFATGAINTSDAREKTDVTPLTPAELAAAADLSRAIGTYQWLESVRAKGTDARHHAGLTVQQAISIMQAHGLDPFRYGFICYDQWDELPEVVNSWPAQDAVLDDAGNVITPAVEAGSEITQEYRPAGDRYSFRHDELLLFMARGFAARLDALEAK